MNGEILNAMARLGGQYASQGVYPGSGWDNDDDGEARYEQEANDDLPAEGCPDCECCDKAWCWANLCAGYSCPCTES